MKKLLLIVIALAFASSIFAQELRLKKNVDVHIQFKNIPSGFGQYGFLITANFGYGSNDNLNIDADWFFENPDATRNLIGQVKWRNLDNEVFAIQKFYKKNVNYYELPDYGYFRQVDVKLGRLEYLDVLGPVE